MVEIQVDRSITQTDRAIVAALIVALLIIAALLVGNAAGFF